MTEREKYLMLQAYEAAIFEMAVYHEVDPPAFDLKEKFEEWLSNAIADNGGTVEQYLEWECNTKGIC